MTNVVNNGNIIQNLRADIMRKAMQPKGLLSDKGGIYVGTGQYEDIVAGDDTYRIYKTVELYPGSGVINGTPLVTDSGETCGLKFGPISGSLIDNYTLSVSKLRTSDPANKILVSNGPGVAPTFQDFNINLIPDNTITAKKLTTDVCDTTTRTSNDGLISISLSQDATTNKIKVNTVTINDYSKIAPYIVYRTVAEYLKRFSIQNNILYIS